MKPSKTIELDCIWARSRLLLFGWSLKRTKNAGNEIGNFVQMAWKICVSWLWLWQENCFHSLALNSQILRFTIDPPSGTSQRQRKCFKKKTWIFIILLLLVVEISVFQLRLSIILFLDILIIWHAFLDINIEARQAGQAKAGFQANVCILLQLKEVRTYRRSR